MTFVQQTDPARLLRTLVASPIAPDLYPDLDSWLPIHQSLMAKAESSIEVSITTGLAADRAGWALASGYQAALRMLLPALPRDAMVAMCISEQGGNSPKAIESTLTRVADGQLLLTGCKRWTTLGPASSILLVAAREVSEAAAPKDQRARIRLVQIASDTPGVVLEQMPTLAFIPEVPHGQPRFEAVKVSGDALLPGDGYDRYVKPFRSCEDVLVSAALLAYLLNQARLRQWPHNWCERAISTLLSFASLSTLDPSAPATHLALAGTLASTGVLYEEANGLFSAGVQDEAAKRWTRDSALLRLAGPVRDQRATRAWERLQQGS